MKFFLAFFIITAINSCLLCQEWAPIGATWYLDAYDLFGYNKHVSTLTSLKDTVIQGRTCKLIYRDETTCLARPNNEFMYEENNQVFYYNFEREEFNLLVDFKAGIGETWEIPLWGFDDTLIVRVDSVKFLTSHDSLRVQYVSESLNGTEYYNEGRWVIDKIGFNNGLFIDISGYFPCDINFEGPIRCYEDNEVGLIKLVEDACETVPVKDIKLNNELIKIFPNPTFSEVKLEIIHSDYSNLSYQLYSIEGKLLKTNQLLGNSIDLRTIPSGTYFLKLCQKFKIIGIKKLIKS